VKEENGTPSNGLGLWQSPHHSVAWMHATTELGNTSQRELPLDLPQNNDGRWHTDLPLASEIKGGLRQRHLA